MRDFNTTPDPHLDSSSLPTRGWPALNSLLPALQLYDVRRHVEEQDYTLFSTCHNSYLRIDVFLEDQWTHQKMSSSSILPITWSDHALVCITLEDGPKSLSAYFWQSTQYENVLHANHAFFPANKDSVDDPNILWTSHKKLRKQCLDSLLAEIQSTNTQ